MSNEGKAVCLDVCQQAVWTVRRWEHTWRSSGGDAVEIVRRNGARVEGAQGVRVLEGWLQEMWT